MKHNFSFETQSEHITVENEASFLRLRNEIQKDLMNEYVLDSEVSDKFEGLSEEQKKELRRDLMGKWAELFSKKFREIFHRTIVANPHFLEDLKTIPEVEYEILKEELYREESTVHPEEIEETLAI